MRGAAAACTGLLTGGCRLLFAAAEVFRQEGETLRHLSRQLEGLGGALVPVTCDREAVLMAAGAALGGARAAALTVDGSGAVAALTGADDLVFVLLDVSGRLPLGLPVRLMMAPHTAQTAFDAARCAFADAAALRGPAMLAGLDCGPAPLDSDRPGQAPPLPIYHQGPDNPDLLLVGAGPGFAACDAARERLEAVGVAVAHLHLIQVSPFPAAIVAPALSSARRVLVVEPGGPGTLSALLRSHLGQPVQPFGELPRLAGTPLGVEQIVQRAQEVVAL